MYHETTHNISVSVMPVLIDERSDPKKGKYFWAYQVVIENRGTNTATLINRYWRITDGNGVVEEVFGLGVVGEQPSLHPGDTYEYTSFCPLATPSGIMAGHYEMQIADGSRIEVTIPAFSLDLPDAEIVYN